MYTKTHFTPSISLPIFNFWAGVNGGRDFQSFILPFFFSSEKNATQRPLNCFHGTPYSLLRQYVTRPGRGGFASLRSKIIAFLFLPYVSLSSSSLSLSFRSFFLLISSIVISSPRPPVLPLHSLPYSPIPYFVPLPEILPSLLSTYPAPLPLPSPPSPFPPLSLSPLSLPLSLPPAWAV